MSTKIYGILTILAQRCPSFGRSCVAICVPHLTEKLGDLKLKKPAGDALVAFGEKTSLQFVLGQGAKISHFINHSFTVWFRSLRAFIKPKGSKGSIRCLDVDKHCPYRIWDCWSIAAIFDRLSQDSIAEFKCCCSNKCNEDSSHCKVICWTEYVTVCLLILAITKFRRHQISH